MLGSSKLSDKFWQISSNSSRLAKSEREIFSSTFESSKTPKTSVISPFSTKSTAPSGSSFSDFCDAFKRVAKPLFTFTPRIS